MDIIKGLIDEKPVKEPKTKEQVCIICEEEFTYTVKRGRAPKLCPSDVCRSTHRKNTRKPIEPKVREHHCIGEDCEVIITQTGRGRAVERCDPCRKEHMRKQNQQYRKKNFVSKERDQGDCVDCNTPLGIKQGRGKLQQRCEGCNRIHRNIRAKISARANYNPVTREYTCGICEDTFKQEGRGKLRKTCPTCVASPSKPQDMGSSNTLNSDEVTMVNNLLEGF